MKEENSEPCLIESYSSYSDTQDTSDDAGMSLKEVLIKKFKNKTAKLND